MTEQIFIAFTYLFFDFILPWHKITLKKEHNPSPNSSQEQTGTFFPTSLSLNYGIKESKM